jgi:hypothetical protein
MVGKQVELFLNSLDKPLQLNEMRVMKEANYARFREILSDVTLYGDELLALLKTQSKFLGVSKQAFDAVYEGFWDLYCKKPHAAADIPVKRLESFLQRVKLVVPPPEGTDEEGNPINSVAKLPLKACVRVRIPLNRPVIEMQEGEDQE